MATPTLQYRKDLIVMVDWDTPVADGASYAYANWCGATSITLSIDNPIQETTVADCDDWSLPAETIAAYGAQTVTSTVNAQLTKAGRDRLIRGLLAQKELPMRFHLIEATTGEIEYIDGIGLISGSIDNIGAVDNNSPITYSLNVRFKQGVELTDAV